MKTLAVSVLALALAAATLAPVAAQPSPPAQGTQRAPMPDLAAARARVAAKWEQIKAEGFSGAVRIDLAGDIVIRAAAGEADPATHRPWTPDTQFEIGSLTKPMTAAGILRLQDQGRLSVNDPLSKFFPGIPADKGAITLHQLMVHASGMPEQAGPLETGGDLNPVGRDAWLARAFASPLRFEPGKDFLYSNAGYSLLAAVIEKVTGEDYETWLKREILIPGGAARTGYRSVYDPVGSARNREGKDISTCCWGPGALSWNLLGNGGIVSNLDDFVRWRKAFAAGKIVSAAAVAAAGTGWVPEPEGSGAEGYGWIIDTSPTRGRIEMAAGGNAYFTTEMRHYPDLGVTTLVTTNSRALPPGEVAGRLVRAMFGEPDLPPPGAPSQMGAPGEVALLDAFVAAVAEPDPAKRRAFLEAHVGPVFRQNVGIEKIAERLDGLHRDLAGVERVERRFGQQGGALLIFHLRGGARKSVNIDFGGTPEKPRLAGFDMS